jgi:hypothetical protein
MLGRVVVLIEGACRFEWETSDSLLDHGGAAEGEHTFARGRRPQADAGGGDIHESRVS